MGGDMRNLKIIYFVAMFFLCMFLSIHSHAEYGSTDNQDLAFKMPWNVGHSGDEEGSENICPQGANTITRFLVAWEKGEYAKMYEEIDADSIKDYTIEQARLDFGVLKFKPYNLSSAKKIGENFEFILSYGDWGYGNKDMKKIIISGKTFKILLQKGNSIFKISAADYF
ncbi:secreted protein [Candidatus Omnitrophus magneticus]|uniref:Secreted protein n=1 Tax=Candidatus Omnitrophus magneticus TaxID=1609969 RepID=A0A0F0CPG6_9BACT|nr:secreted protein [Candidatus Omnitrophus magneticus]